MAKALKAKGFKFCGPVIVYAFMQATGLVNDHLDDLLPPRGVPGDGRAGTPSPGGWPRPIGAPASSTD
ncbi:DNA-3-methyladenine glycosylase I [Caulobacter segnis]